MPKRMQKKLLQNMLTGPFPSRIRIQSMNLSYNSLTIPLITPVRVFQKSEHPLDCIPMNLYNTSATPQIFCFTKSVTMYFVNIIPLKEVLWLINRADPDH